MDGLKIIIIGLVIGLFISFSFQHPQTFNPSKGDISIGIDERDNDGTIVDEGFGGGVKRQIEPGNNTRTHPQHEG